MATITIYQRVHAIVVDKLGVEAAEVTETAHFEDDLNADSLDLVELVMALEEEFGIEIGEKPAAEIRTVDSVVAWLKEQGVKDA